MDKDRFMHSPGFFDLPDEQFALYRFVVFNPVIVQADLADTGNPRIPDDLTESVPFSLPVIGVFRMDPVLMRLFLRFLL